MPPTKLVSSAIVLAVTLGIVALVTSAAIPPAKGYANFEAAQTTPVRLSADETRLFAVNTANNSLSVFDVTQPANPVLMVEIPVGIGPVSVNSRTNDEVWVVNQVSNSVSVVSVSKGIVTDTIHACTEPADLVFAGSNQAYVSCSRDNEIGVFDANAHTLITQLPVFGGSPRAMTVSADGNTVYTAFAISGNATTIIPTFLAPPQPPPLNPKLPPAPAAGLIVSATDPNWRNYLRFKMPDNDVVAISAGPTPTISAYYSGVGTVNLGIAINPVNGDLFVSNTDALNLTFFQPSLRGHWVNNRVTRVQTSTGRVTPFDLNPNIDYKILPNPAALATALAQPAGIVFEPSGSSMYIAAFGTDRVAQVDTNGNVLAFVELSPTALGSKADPKNKRGPRGLAINATAQVVYSLNRISNTISVINTAQMMVSQEIPIGSDPTPVLVKQGRGFLYDAKLSGNGTGACSSCHVDGDTDHLAWNLGDRSGNLTTVMQQGKVFTFHPMKGPMDTQTLRGLPNVSPYHWRGDRATFAAFNINFDVIMGGSPVSPQDMGTFNGFINTVLFLPNPNENLDRSLPTSLAGGDPAAGQVDYLTIPGTQPHLTCNNCHTADPGAGTNRSILIGIDPQPMKVPHLRNVYQKLLYTRHNAQSIDGFGLEHDGNISQPNDLLGKSIFNGYTSQQKTDITSYLLCFDTGVAPAVGYTITLTSANVTGQKEQSDWNTLQSQALGKNIDLIARGTIQGRVHGLVYQPSTSSYQSDAKNEYTQAQLQALIESGDTLSFEGVYLGTGKSK